MRSANRRNSLVTGVQLIRAIAAEIRRQQPQIVHAYMTTAYVLGAVSGKLAGVPIIISSRRGLVTYRHYPYRRWQWFARLANRLIDCQISNSEAVRQLALEVEGLSFEKTTVIYNGIDVPQMSERVEFPSEWRMRESDGCAAMVANFHIYKGHLDVLEAARLVVQHRPRFKLVLFGDGALRPEIEAFCAKNGLQENVILAGARLDAPNLLSTFDFTILASSQEGFPNAVMESMARRVPVIATRVGGIPELVRDGIDGKLVEFGRPDQMSAAMLELLQDAPARHRMGDAARTRIIDEFSVQAMVARTEEVYEKLLALKAGRNYRSRGLRKQRV